MNILAFDTSDKVLSVALSVNGSVWHYEVEAEESHSELILEIADSLCKMANFDKAELNLAACMKGPGSFTGLRIGFSTAKGLALALGIPIRAIPTLDCIAHSYSIWPGLVIPAIDAKKSRFFTAMYRKGKRLNDYCDITPKEIADEVLNKRHSESEPVLLTGGGAQLLYSSISTFIPDHTISIDPNYNSGRAKELLQIVKNEPKNINNDINGGPVYLRKSDAELNLK